MRRGTAERLRLFAGTTANSADVARLANVLPVAKVVAKVVAKAVVIWEHKPLHYGSITVAIRLQGSPVFGVLMPQMKRHSIPWERSFQRIALQKNHCDLGDV